MTNFYVWVATHRHLARFLVILLVFLPFGALCVYLDMPALLIGALGFILLFFILIGVNSAHALAEKRAIVSLHTHCDPEPLLRVTEKLLAGKLSVAARTDVLIDHAIALRELGELTAVKRILMEMNIDKEVGTLAYTKVIYYNNLSDILALLGAHDEAEIWYAKALKIYADMPENKIKRMLDTTLRLATAEHHIRVGEYAKASQILGTVKLETPSVRIQHALLRAELCLKKEDLDAAKRLLAEIVQRGGKLYAVTQAKQHLANLDQM